MMNKTIALIFLLIYQIIVFCVWNINKDDDQFLFIIKFIPIIYVIILAM